MNRRKRKLLTDHDEVYYVNGMTKTFLDLIVADDLTFDGQDVTYKGKKIRHERRENPEHRREYPLC